MTPLKTALKRFADVPAYLAPEDNWSRGVAYGRNEMLSLVLPVLEAADEANELSKEDATRYPQLDKTLDKLRAELGMG